MSSDKMIGSPNFKWFGLAVQALVVLSEQPSCCPSGKIACQLQSEATLLRRILSKLACEGILETREGRDGGYRLKRTPEEISLKDVYLALEEKGPCCSEMLETTGDHDFGRDMHESFSAIVQEVNVQVLQVLEKYTVADLL
ncbi:Rrf2 family transcriptional regulator [Paenibacillus zeisoli]|uniref:Rrf2 family transcriptional regulator n=1 Tax=Paenibacillus zeisoli TaxID=2496267 RepID=A0A433XH64_9BACL|nr:Rrf2 family transcriptional regulator [Paenibacillus zeisoli]RUT33400.1 Rrf2 family transcriptional regulator [Paenibacillus zeisoli]